MVRLQLNKKIKKQIKLIGVLIGNEKKMMLCSFVSVIVGFTFMFMVSSLSGTIIKTKQDNTVNKYGKFLMVLPDIDNESEKEIKQKCIDFKYEHFGVVGNVEYANKKITIGTMTEDMGATLAFKLIKGKWVKGSDQIVVEEYLLKLFGKENTQLPFDIKLKKDGRFINYKVTGVISNYSSVISTSYDKELETKVYPSIICGQKNDKDVKNSLVILQKKLDFKKAKSDIENVLFQNISEEAICANEKLHWHGYSDNEDMINIKELIQRLGNQDVKEIIMATNPTIEGEATAMYIARLIKPMGIKVTRIAHGLPIGGDLEYADEVTISKALEGRREI